MADDANKKEDASKKWIERLLSDLSHWTWSLVAAPVASIIGILIYTLSIDSWSAFGAGLVVAAAAWITGGFLGFLFAIPKSRTTSAGDDPAHHRYLANSNLVEISDWLTKILVGLGLVELGRLTVETRKLVDFIAPELGARESSRGFGLAILVVFSVSGFLSLYLVTRLYVLVTFVRVDAMIRKEVELILIDIEQARQAVQSDQEPHGIGDSSRDPPEAISGEDIQGEVL